MKNLEFDQHAFEDIIWWVQTNPFTNPSPEGFQMRNKHKSGHTFHAVTIPELEIQVYDLIV